MAVDLALILHAHLPFVRPAGKEILEERWLYEAVAESYLPLLWSLERLQAEGVPVRLALSLSGPLLCMLGDTGLMARCRAHLARVAELARQEAERQADSPQAAVTAFYRDRYARILEDLQSGPPLLQRFRALAAAGALELFTAAGTHGLLPLLGSDEVRSAQLRASVEEFVRHFGHPPGGIWLPECAYAPGLDHLLAASDLQWFVCESQAVAAAYPPVAGPVLLTPGGVAALARDDQAARQVWDSRAGYPGDPVYREFYRDAGFDLPLEQVADCLVDGQIRSDTGLKYYRITGEGAEKLLYDPALAQERAEAHAHHFAQLLRERGEGLVVAPFDCELFGHWWFEGPHWIEALFRELAADAGVHPVTPSGWLAWGPVDQVARLPASTWGDGGDFRVWLSPENGWLWPELHRAEQEMLALVSRGDLPQAVLDQAARELLLAESSDWPFILHFKTAAEYARRRVQTHLERFRLLAAGKASPERFGPEDGIFPALNGRRLYQRRRPVPSAGPLRLLLLSWEFPPHNVGGLGRHVYDLGAALALAGHVVHVITIADEIARPGVSHVAGMRVHRVPRPPEQSSFLAWTYRLNQAMTEAAIGIWGGYGPFDLIHSHDWLVGQAGMALKARWGSALVATIHATERGRNSGIRAEIQQAIHEEEWLLTQAADQVITVSQAMAREVAASFQVSPTVIYNGVTMPKRAGPPPLPLDAPYFFYIGRLVVEKGVQVAIAAISRMAQRVHLVIAGKGPMEAELQALAASLGVADRVHFLGRVSDKERDAWLQGAAGGLVPSLYEPFGIVALEVMAAGAPVIVGDTGGLAEIVTHLVDGIRVPPGDAGALAEAMDLLATNREQAAALAGAGWQTAAGRFGWESIAQQTLAVYRKAGASDLERHARDQLQEAWRQAAASRMDEPDPGR